ncbi:MAG: metal-sensing transcriptional repressor [Ketobacteraceae bacterium]|nr:metal-sensing transcriptional repressor [Ketobacteraceae bacterium]
MNTDDNAMQKRLLNRLSRLEGQVRAVRRLVSESEDCEKVLQQMSAVRKAMDKAFYEVLACVIEGEVAGDSAPAASAETMDRVRLLLTRYAS